MTAGCLLRSRWISGLFPVLLTIGAHHVSAQENRPPGSFERVLEQLERSDRLIVTDSDGRTLSGKLVDGTATTIVLQLEKGPRQSVRIPTDRIRSLERRRDSILNGVLIGMAVGGGAVVAMEVSYNDWSEPGIAPAIAAATAVGGCVGAIVDVLIAKPRVRFEAPAAKRSLSFDIAPLALGVRNGVLITLRF